MNTIFSLILTGIIAQSISANYVEVTPSFEFLLTLWNRGIRNTQICVIGNNHKDSELKKFKDWNFSESLLLYSGLPIDPIQSNYVRQVKNAIFSRVKPTPLKKNVRLVALTEDVLEKLLDLDAEDCQRSKDFLKVVSGNLIWNGSVPLAHRYGGHQFGSWASQLGDGRAHLLGQFVNNRKERWELQLKGSGRTPYSRRGDGRAVLRSSIREYLCSEALHHLRIPTSRAASIVVSDDPVIRDQFYDGHIKQEKAAVVLRVAPSWFRIGSLEILSNNNEITLLRHLVDFIILNYFNSEVNYDLKDKYVQFFDGVMNRTIDTVVHWMSVGFTHGVCNTDNFSLLGLTIDFGPFGFVESYDPDFVPNSSDDEGRYSLQNQPNVAMFNMDKLRLALLPLVDKKQRKKMKLILNSFNEKYQKKLMKIFRKKLGLFNELEGDSLLVASLLYLMKETKSDFTMTFRNLGSLSMNDLKTRTISESLWSLQQLKKHEMFNDWIESYYKRLLKNAHFDNTARQCRMNSVNPRYILRNWIAELAIRKAEDGDYSEVDKISRILKKPYIEQEEAEINGFAAERPEWANYIKVSCSS